MAILRSIIFFTVLMFISGAEAAVINKPANYSGLVGYWSFNNTTTNVAQDFSGNSNHGSIKNMATTSAVVAGNVGQALYFDGTNDYVLGPDINSIDGSSVLTVSVWVKPAALTTADHFVAKNNSCCSSSFGFRTDDSDSNDVRFNVSTGANNATTNSNVLAVDQWTHLTAVYDGSLANSDRIKIYVNGVDSGTVSGTIPTTIPSTTYQVTIGAAGEIGRYFNGTIDEVKIFTRALSASEVRTLYQTGKTKVISSDPAKSTTINVSKNDRLTSNLAGLWSFNGSDTNWSTNKALDRSGNGRDASMINMSTTTSPVGGKVGQALLFTNSTNRLVTTSDPIGTGATTITAWIYLNSYGGGNLGRIVDNTKTLFYVTSSSNRLSFSSNVTVNDAFSAASSIGFNRWIFVAVARNSSGTANLYVDGLLSGTANQNSGTPSSGATIMYIGNSSATTRGFDGKIDELRVYNAELSASQIYEIYKLGKS